MPLPTRAPFHPPHFETVGGAAGDAAAAAEGGVGIVAAPEVAAEEEESGGRAKGKGQTKARGGGNGICKAIGDGWYEPNKKLSNKVLRAVLQHVMLRPGDRVMLGLSGGKDSLCLLHVLHGSPSHRRTYGV